MTQQVSYLTADHLGSPRVITDQNGDVTSRKDFTAFGEENYTAQRTEALGYEPDTIRKGYTGYEKDDESGLDFAQARYYNASHGRYTSIDPLTASASIKNPQTFNRYSYVLNSPYKFTDPLGLLPLTSAGACGNFCPNSGPTIDGSAFRGRDTTFEHLKTISELTSGFMSWLRAGTLALNAADALARQRAGRNTVVFAKTKYVSYDVAGNNAADAAGNAGSVPDLVKKCGDSGGGCTDPYWDATPQKGGGFRITVTLTVYVTKWTGYDAADQLERKLWDGYAFDVKKHEETHVLIFQKLFQKMVADQVPTSLKSGQAFLEHKKFLDGIKAIYTVHDAFDDFDLELRSKCCGYTRWNKQ